MSNALQNRNCTVKVYAHKRSQHAVEHTRTNTRLLAKIKRIRLYPSLKSEKIRVYAC